MKQDEKLRKLFFLVTFAILLYFGLLRFSNVLKFIEYMFSLLTPFLLGLGIAFILNVLLNIVENRIFARLNKRNTKRWQKIKRPVCLITTLLLVIGLFVFIVYLVVPELKNAFEILLASLPNNKADLKVFAEELKLPKDIVNNIIVVIDGFHDKVTPLFKNNFSQILNVTMGVASSVIGAVMNLIIGIVFAIYILLQKETLSGQFQKILYAFFPKRVVQKVEDLSALSFKTCSNFVAGQFTEAVIIGLLCFIGMLVFRMPYAPTISVLVGFTALIPMFGAFIGTGIGAFLIFMVNPMQAVAFVIFIIVLQQFEGNLIYPKVVGKSVGLPGMWVMVAVTLGASMFGLLGMIISVPICSIVYSVFATYVNNRLKKRQITIS